jgi:hypothetical protein
VDFVEDANEIMAGFRRAEERSAMDATECDEVEVTLTVAAF